MHGAEDSRASLPLALLCLAPSWFLPWCPGCTGRSYAGCQGSGSCYRWSSSAVRWEVGSCLGDNLPWFSESREPQQIVRCFLANLGAQLSWSQCTLAALAQALPGALTPWASASLSEAYGG